jgi:hypothetical protein
MSTDQAASIGNGKAAGQLNDGGCTPQSALFALALTAYGAAANVASDQRD